LPDAPNPVLAASVDADKRSDERQSRKNATTAKILDGSGRLGQKDSVAGNRAAADGEAARRSIEHNTPVQLDSSPTAQHWSPNTPQRRNVTAIAFAALQAHRAPSGDAAKSVANGSPLATASATLPPPPGSMEISSSRAERVGSLSDKYHEIAVYRDSIGKTFLRQGSGDGLRLYEDETGSAVSAMSSAAIDVSIDPRRWTRMANEECRGADGKPGKNIVYLEGPNGKWVELTFEEAVVGGRRMHANVQARMFRRWMRQVNQAILVGD
jgi:hypothetical protein